MDVHAMICALVPILAAISMIIVRTDGHGRLIEPPSRSSMWRYGFHTPVNYDDNQLFCGGYDVQWHQNGGRCGVCGDPFNGPRDNESGGRYATGTIVRRYTEGQTITVGVDVTVNHGGYFEFRICPNNNPSKPVTGSCLNRTILRQRNGDTEWHLPAGARAFYLQLLLPRGLTCTQCVLQWKYNTASNWGCENGNCCKGCGPQEQFYGCADVSVTRDGSTSASGSLVPGSSIFGIPSASDTIDKTPQSSDTVSESANQEGSGFIPINSGSANHDSGFIPINRRAENQNSGFIPINRRSANQKAVCEATPIGKSRYPLADGWCQTQCAVGTCPSDYCADGCRVIYKTYT